MYSNNVNLTPTVGGTYNLILPTNNNIKRLFLNVSNNSQFRIIFKHNNIQFFRINPLTDFSFMLPDYVKDQIDLYFETVASDRSYIANNTVNIQISEATENYNQNYIAYDTFAFQSEITKIFAYYANNAGTVKIIHNHLILDSYGNNTIPYHYIKNLTANFFHLQNSVQSMDFVFQNANETAAQYYALTASNGTTDQLVIDNSILNLDTLTITLNSGSCRGSVLLTYV